MRQLKPTDIRPGDILLHAGKGEISKLIKWVSDSDYSHVAFACDKDFLTEASSRGVNKLQPIADRAADADNFSRIDVIRPKIAPSAADMKKLRDSANALAGQRFALNQMFELGLICAVKNKTSDNMGFKVLLTWLLTYLIPDDPDRLVCSEFVYLSYHNAGVPALDPEIIVTAPENRPFPEVDFVRLWKEYEEAREREGQATPPALAHQILKLQTQPLDSIIMQSREKLLQHRAGQLKVLLPAPPPPNAFLVLPEDLRDSPTFEFIGQLMP